MTNTVISPTHPESLHADEMLHPALFPLKQVAVIPEGASDVSALPRLIWMASE